MEVTPEAQAEAARVAAAAQLALIRLARSERAMRLLPVPAEDARPGWTECRGAHFVRHHGDVEPPRQLGSRRLPHRGWPDAARAHESPPSEPGQAAIAWLQRDVVIDLRVGDGEPLAPPHRLHLRFKLLAGIPNRGPAPTDLRFHVYALVGEQWTQLLARTVRLDTHEVIDLRDAMRDELDEDAVPRALAVVAELPAWEVNTFTGAVEIAATTAVRVR